MTIQCDSREHKSEYDRIAEQFDALGVQYFRSKLPVGDYMSLDNPRLVIDRKKDLLELCGNVTQQHERFKAELVRAKEYGIKLIILVEHGADIRSLEDVYFWQNPRKHEVRWRWKDGKRIKTVISSKAVDGNQLYKSLNTMHERYGVDFAFCQKSETGKKIVEILSGDFGGDQTESFNAGDSEEIRY